MILLTVMEGTATTITTIGGGKIIGAVGGMRNETACMVGWTAIL
jgi:hypothetical protein